MSLWQSLYMVWVKVLHVSTLGPTISYLCHVGHLILLRAISILIKGQLIVWIVLESYTHAISWLTNEIPCISQLNHSKLALEVNNEKYDIVLILISHYCAIDWTPLLHYFNIHFNFLIGCNTTDKQVYCNVASSGRKYQKSSLEVNLAFTSAYCSYNSWPVDIVTCRPEF